MKLLLLSFLCAAFLSCASRPAPGLPPEIPQEIPPVPKLIMGTGIVPPAVLASFLLDANPNADPAFVRDLARLYVEEAAIEEVNHDMAFAQMCLETGFLQYGNLVQPDMNNFCGLGAIDIEHPGERFPDPRTGVRAQIQHLKGYASAEPLEQTLVDPRYRWIRPYGKAPAIRDLTGTWAVDRSYGDKLDNMLERLYLFSFLPAGQRQPTASQQVVKY
jgi:hypothetical protein